MAFNDTPAQRKDTRKQQDGLIAVLAATGAVFKKGDIVVSPGGTGLAVPAFAAASGATGDCFEGIAQESKTCVAGETILVDAEWHSRNDFTIATTTQAAAVGRPAYSESGAGGNAQFITLTAPVHPIRVGTVVELADGSVTVVRVAIEPFAWMAA